MKLCSKCKDDRANQGAEKTLRHGSTKCTDSMQRSMEISDVFIAREML